jgi:hypothetical protein
LALASGVRQLLCDKSPGGGRLIFLTRSSRQAVSNSMRGVREKKIGKKLIRLQVTSESKNNAVARRTPAHKREIDFAREKWRVKECSI